MATNRDAFDRLSDRNIPGNGSMVAAIEVSIQKEPVMVGKPSKWLIERVISSKGLDRSRTVMIGDRLDTDVLFGRNGGLDSLCVLTGCSTAEDIMNQPTDFYGRPTAILPFVGALITRDQGITKNVVNSFDCEIEETKWPGPNARL